MVEYLGSKNSQYYYNTVTLESLVIKLQVDSNPMEITGCIKQNLIVFKPKKKLLCKEKLLLPTI